MIKTIAIDLTPVLPGGENGGAKVFLLELLKSLASYRPNVNFILLTRSESHEELRFLDRENMNRLLVLVDGAPIAPEKIAFSLKRLNSNFLSRFFESFKKIFSPSSSGEKFVGQQNSLMRILGAELLFCPFTAMTYADTSVPSVSTIYDWQHRVYPQFFEPTEVIQRDQTLDFVSRHAAAIATISDFSRCDTLKYGGVDSSRVKTIYLRMANRTNKIASNDMSIFQKMNIQPHKYFIYPAKFWKHKNHEMLLTGFRIAIHTGLSPDFKLILTGAPSSRRNFLMSAAKKMGLEDSVLFPGYLSTHELSILMKNSRGLVFPSLYEGFGLPPVEAMSAGVPVACSNFASLPEIVSSAAALFDPRKPEEIAKKMLLLQDDGALREGLIELGLNRAAIFADSERMTHEYWNLFEQAVLRPNKTSVITGVYPDGGWLQERFRVEVTFSDGLKNLELEVEAPGINKDDKIELRVRNEDSGLNTQNIFVENGAKKKISIDLIGAGAIYFEVLNTFTPDEVLGNGDKRKLSLILKSCRINMVDESYIELFSENK